jgi:transposase
MAECPLCGTRSRRIHSRYHRQVADLPSAGKQVRLRVITRRFVCEVPHCRRRIFAERFGDDVLPTRSRRTARLECIVYHLGLALRGRPAASFARRLMLPVSNDTLLRVVRRRSCPRTEPLIVAGIDDWAFRKNHRYDFQRLPFSHPALRFFSRPTSLSPSFSFVACHLSSRGYERLSYFWPFCFSESFYGGVACTTAD